MLLHAPLPVEAPKWTDPHTKVNALLQAHFSRSSIPSGDLAADQRTVLQQTTRLLQVCLIPATPGCNPLCKTSVLIRELCNAKSLCIISPWTFQQSILDENQAAPCSIVRH